MKGFLFRLVITGPWLVAGESIVPGVRIDGWGNLVVAALLLGIVNAVIRPIILILTLRSPSHPGLFILVVTGFRSPWSPGSCRGSRSPGCGPRSSRPSLWA